MVRFSCIYVSSLAVGSMSLVYCNRQGNSGLAWFRNGDLRIEGVKLWVPHPLSQGEDNVIHVPS